MTAMSQNEDMQGAEEQCPGG